MKLGLGFFLTAVSVTILVSSRERSRRVENHGTPTTSINNTSFCSSPMLARAVRAANPLRAHARAMTIAVGSKFPSVEVDKASWPPEAFNIADHIANKKVIVVGLPGAFTPT